MNFLSEVLSTAGETQMNNMKDKIPKIVFQIGKLKSEVVNYLKNVHINFKLMKRKSNAFLEDALKLYNEMQVLTNEIDELFKRNVDDSKVELENLSADLEESSYALELVTQFVEIDNYFKKAKECLYKKAYLDAIINVDALNKLLDELCIQEQLDIIQVLVISASIEHETIKIETRKVWHECITIDKAINDNETILTIKINTSRSDELKESMKALCYDNLYFFELECLSNFLKEIFTSIVNHHCVVEIDDSALSVKVKDKFPKQQYDQVFCNIANVIEFISVTINFEVKEDALLLSLIGHKIHEEFCEQLIKNTLADAIPSTQEELEKYSVVAEKIEILQKMLTECQFFSDRNEAILEYAKNVDVLFANKACQIFLDRARAILKKDLHDMIEVGMDNHTDRVDLSDSDMESVLVFPKCYISRNVLEYLDLIREVLDQASLGLDLCRGRFVLTADHMIGFYYSLIPEYHRKLLESIPQQVALFHNNCMYIAHEIFMLNKYKDQQVHIALKELNFSTHKDHMKVVATDLFMKYIQSQIKQIEDILKQLEFTKLGDTDQIDPNCEKYIRQCLRQLELLKTVWQKVLSYEVYNKTIGQLLNSFVGFLIKLVIGVEDISAINCTLLVEMFGIVKTRGPKLFTEPKEINLYVKQWYKFNELILLLNSSLSDINDRWASGKGPLAVEFKPDEVKGLIRALFQNTERRAAVLVRIN